jgi:BMFP domain-containing protein YqiC
MKAGRLAMQTQNKLLDDLARVASGAIGVAAGMREEVEARLRDQFERVLGRMDLVTREEFEAVRAMAIKAREEQEILSERVAALEAALETTPKGAAKGGTKARKPAAAKAKPRRKRVTGSTTGSADG